MRVKNPNELKLLGAALLLLIAPAISGQTTSTSSSSQTERPIQMLVIGDSILWGQGLKTERKTWYLVKVWLEKNTGRKVNEKIEAHSGAVIERSSATDDLTSENGEVNLALPTLHEEIDNALKQYAHPNQVDLVLLSGCGNDVGLLNLLNAVDRTEVAEMTREKCGQPVEKLLQRTLITFPNAYVVVTGYYPFFSERTRNDFIVKALAKKFFKRTRDDGAKRTSNKEVFERLKLNSLQWYETSNSRLAEAVDSVNTAAGNSSHRVVFAKIDFPPDYSFAAPKTHLWGFDRSPFRIMLLVMSFGKILLPSNDQMLSERSASCSQIYKQPANETTEEKNKRKANKLLCRYAALGHPNKTGAVLYADAITNLLKSKFAEATSTVSSGSRVKYK